MPSSGEVTVDYAVVPAGQYIVVATTSANPDGSDYIECRINDGAYYSVSGATAPITVTDQVYLGQQGAIDFKCSSETGDTSSWVDRASLSVIAADHVDVSILP
jgi:hypothetical protein